MMAATFEENIGHIRQLYSKVGSSARVDDFTVNKSIFLAMDLIRDSVATANEKSFSNANLATLEDICNGASVSLVRSTLINLVAIYTAIIKKAPGYVVRNILNSMIVICNGKTASNISRECAVQVITSVMVNKPNDCANQINEIVVLLTKLSKLSDLALKISCLKCVSGIITGSGSKIGDVHAEMLKMAVRFSADKSVEVRVAVAEIMRLVAEHSEGFTSVPMDSVLSPACRGLEDETAIVQDAFAAAVSAVFSEQVNSYLTSQEQAKQGMARGSASAKSTKKPQPLSQRMSITKLTMSTKKIVDEWDFRSVVGYLHKQLTLGSNTLRTGYLTVLGYLVRSMLDALSPDDYKWLVISTIEVLKDSPALRELTYEEQAHLRCRFSHFLRSSITAAATEAQLLTLAGILIKHISTVETGAHSDLELQLVLGELGNVITCLGPAATALVEEVNMSTSTYLRHSNFGVRSASAQVLSSMAVAVPVIATELLRSALLNTQSQVKQLLQFDPSELAAEAESTGALLSDAEQQQALAAARRRNSKEQERLQRIYFFHGHTLGMSALLKNAAHLPNGLPEALVSEIYAYGVELLGQDVLAVPPSVRHVICSVVRAGSLIVASCLSMGYRTAVTHLPQLLSACGVIFQVAASPAAAGSAGGLPHSNSSGSLSGQSASANGGTKSDELVYEVMCVEAALVCVSTLLRFCPEALTYAPHEDSAELGCLSDIVEGLDLAFRALRGKYQPRLRTHFRFRTLHAILLECFALLPPGSFPQTCAPIFIEALRMFSAGVSAGFETTLLGEFLSEQHSVLRVGAGQASACNITTAFQAYVYEAPMSEHLLMMKLETHAIALEKKENEAFLSIYAPDQPPCNVLQPPNEAKASVEDAPPCANVDSRTIDAAVRLLGRTFGWQTLEYQEKAVQFCAQAVAQFAKAGGKSAMGLFSSTSEEERRRKDRMNYSTIRIVLATLCSVVRSFPALGASVEDAPWRQTVVGMLYDMLAHPSYTIRSAAATGLSEFALKAPSTRVVSTVSAKIRTLMMTSLEKRVIDANSALDHAGYLVALSSLWGSVGDSEDVKSLISTTVFDSLRKVTSSLPFRAQGLLTLSVFVQDLLSQTAITGIVEAQDLLEKILGVIESHIANLNYNTSSPISIAAEEVELFSVCLARLLNVSCALSLRLYNLGHLDADGLHERLNAIRTGVFNDRASPAVRNESLNFFRYVVPVDGAGKYTKYLLTWFKSIIEESDDYSLQALQSVLSAVLPLVKEHSELSCEIGLDSDLFPLLNYLLSRTTAPHTNAFAGIEVRKGALLEDSITAQVNACIGLLVQCIYTLCAEDVRRAPDLRIIHWVLLCRCVALNTRSMGRPEEAGGEGGAAGGAAAGGGDTHGDEDGDEGGNDGGDFGSDPAASNAVGVFVVEAMTCTKFAAYCRERALEHAPDLDYCRVQLKCVAVRCILIALTHISGSVHSDLGEARAATDAQLRAIQGKHTSAEALAAVPRYLPLFLTDLVNLSCACATFMIDDKPVLALQQVSMQLMHQVVGLFLYTEDPDIKLAQSGAGAGLDSLTEAVEGRILHQFTSQLLSAVRNGLANTATLFSPKLLHISGSLLCSLIRGGYVSDKIVARRLVKLVIAYCEQGGTITASTGNATSGEAAPSAHTLTVRAPSSQLVCETQSTEMHLVHAVVFAELHSLVQSASTSDTLRNQFVAPAVRATVASMLQEHAAVLSPLWYAVAIDATRVSYFTQKYNVVSTTHLTEAAVDSLFGLAPAHPVTSGAAEIEADSELMLMHPLRGGHTYSSSAAAAGSVLSSTVVLNRSLQETLLQSVPAVLAAHIHCASPSKTLVSPKGKSAAPSAGALVAPTIDLARVLPLFAIAQASLQELFSHEGAAVQHGAVEDLLASLMALSRKDSPGPVNSEAFTYSIPVDEWTHVLNSLLQNTSSLSTEVALNSVAELVSHLAERAVHAKILGSAQTSIDALWLALWNLTLLLVQRYDARLFVDFSASSATSKTVLTPTLNNAAVLVQNASSSSSLAPASGVFVIKTVVRLVVVKDALTPYVSHLLSLILLIETVRGAEITDTDVSKSSTAVLEQITTALAAQRSIAPQLCIQLLQNAHEFVSAYFESTQGATSVDPVPAKVLDLSLAVWRVVALTLDPASIPAPYHLSALILGQPAPLAILAMNAALKFLQSYPDIAPVVAGQLLPAFLTRLSYQNDSTEARVCVIKAFLMFFGIVRAEQKSALVELFLTPMCAKISEHTTDAEFLLTCGRGLTHLARLEPEVFRTQVPLLSERHRTLLQGVMKLALQQSDGSGSNSSSNSGKGFGSASPNTPGTSSGPSGMTINMSKYKK